jgi:hypothetical protein
VVTAFGGEQTWLQGQQRQRVIGTNASLAEPAAGVCVEAGGQIDRKDLAIAGVQLLDAFGQLAIRRTCGADAEQRIDCEVKAV